MLAFRNHFSALNETYLNIIKFIDLPGHFYEVFNSRVRLLGNVFERIMSLNNTTSDQAKRFKSSGQ
jgi:hypothetical protein